MKRDATSFFDSVLSAAILWSFVCVQATCLPRVRDALGMLAGAVESIGGTPVRW